MDQGTGDVTRPSPPAEARLGRLAALSDGVFAISMTLLVLDVSVPPGLDDEDFHAALGEALPNLGAYALSFLVLAQFWRDQRYVLSRMPAADTPAVHLALLGLGLAALVPFPTALLAEYGSRQPLAVASYAGVMAALNAVHLAMLPGRRGRRRRDVDAVERLAARDLAASAAIFLVTVPVAFVSPVAAMLGWLVFVPLKATIGRRQRRAAREEGADPVD